MVDPDTEGEVENGGPAAARGRESSKDGDDKDGVEKKGKGKGKEKEKEKEKARTLVLPTLRYNIQVCVGVRVGGGGLCVIHHVSHRVLFFWWGDSVAGDT